MRSFQDPWETPWQAAQDPAFWMAGMPASPSKTSVAIAKQVCSYTSDPNEMGSCLCQALKGASACPAPVGSAAVFGAMAQAQIFDLIQ
jgi:hypothetical protein